MVLFWISQRWREQHGKGLEFCGSPQRGHAHQGKKAIEIARETGLDNASISYWRRGKYEATKTAAGHRTIPVDAKLLEMVYNETETNERLMEGIHPNTLYNRLQRITEACGMPHVRLHDFRHTFASVSHLLGIPEHYTMAAGGWASRPVMDAVYTHAIDSAGAQFADKVAAFYSELTKVK